MADVKLPNGTIIRNVPEGATKEEIKAKAIAAGLASEEDFTPKAKPQSFSDAPDQFTKLNENIGALESLAIATGRGMYDIARGIGLVDEESETVKKAFQDLEKQRPVSQTIGRAVGQAAPFMIPATGLGAIAGTGAKIAAGAGLGAAEGNIIARGMGGDAAQIEEGTAIGGVIGGATEALFPVVSRVGRSLLRNVKGVEFAGDVLTPNGAPTAQFKSALDKAGISFDDVVDEAKKFTTPQDPNQAARLADFQAAGVPATRGDIMQSSTGGFAQQAMESRLFESSADPIADQFRSFRLQQSDAFTSALKSIAGDANVEDVGQVVKQALNTDRTSLKSAKNAYYKKAAQLAEDKGGIPIYSTAIADIVPDNDMLYRLGNVQGANVQAIKDALTEFNIIPYEDSLKRLEAAGVQPKTLSLKNFEDFRQAIKAAERADVSGTTSVVARPIIEALDNELDQLPDKLVNSLGADSKELMDTLKAARATTRELKTKFSPQSVTGRLIASKRDGETPIIEASRVYKQLVGTNQPVEYLQRTVSRLKGMGDEGTAAMDSLRGAVVADLVDSMFKGNTRKVAGQRIFSPVALQARIAQIGDDKLKLLFGDNSPAYKKIKQMGRIAESITPPSGAVPKGSASFIADALNKLGIMTLSAKMPVAGPIIEFYTSLGEGAAARRTIQQAMNASPDAVKQITALEEIMPNAMAALGIAATQQQAEEENDQTN